MMIEKCSPVKLRILSQTGTEFMVRLHEQLKYFVTSKISSDPLWHGVNVYLSGHEVIITMVTKFILS
jgi:hypothetical protein